MNCKEFWQVKMNINRETYCPVSWLILKLDVVINCMFHFINRLKLEMFLLFGMKGHEGGKWPAVCCYQTSFVFTT